MKTGDYQVLQNADKLAQYNIQESKHEVQHNIHSIMTERTHTW
jgi:hypothetical protein